MLGIGNESEIFCGLILYSNPHISLNHHPVFLKQRWVRPNYYYQEEHALNFIAPLLFLVYQLIKVAA